MTCYFHSRRVCIIVLKILVPRMPLYAFLTIIQRRIFLITSFILRIQLLEKQLSKFKEEAQRNFEAFHSANRLKVWDKFIYNSLVYPFNILLISSRGEFMRQSSFLCFAVCLFLEMYLLKSAHNFHDWWRETRPEVMSKFSLVVSRKGVSLLILYRELYSPIICNDSLQ